MWSRGGGRENIYEYLYDIIIFITACSAGLGLGRPEVKPSTPEPLPGRLRELTGKLGWMNWEPMSLTAKVRGEVTKPILFSQRGISIAR